MKKQQIRKNKFILGIILYVIVFTTLMYVEVPHSDFIQDNFNSKESESNLSLIIGSLASLSGVVIAILLIAFEIKKEKIGKYAREYYLKDNKLIFIVTIFTISISSAFLSKIIIDFNNLGTSKIIILIINYFLFLISIIVTIPLSIKVIFDFDINYVIKKEIDKIKLSDLLNYSAIPVYAAGNTFETEYQYLSITKLRNIAVQYIQIDSSVTKSISREFALKITNIIDNTYNSRGGFNFHIDTKVDSIIVNGIERKGRYLREQIFIDTPYVKFLEDISEKAISDNSLEVLNSIVFDLYHVLSKFNSLKIHPSENRNLLEFTSKYLSRLIRHGYNDIFFNALHSFDKFIEDVFELNCPEQYEVHLIHQKNPPLNYSDKNFHWDTIKDEYLNVYRNLLDESISTKNSETFNSICMSISSTLYVITETWKLGIYQKKYLSFDLHFTLITKIIEAHESWGNDNRLYISHSHPFGRYIKNSIDKEVLYADIFLRQIGYFILELIKIDKLNSFMLLKLFSILRSCLIRYHHSINSMKGFDYLIKVIFRIKDSLEKNLDENYYFYNALYEQVLHLKESNKYKISKIDDKIDNLLSSFKELNSIDLEKNGDIKW